MSENRNVRIWPEQFERLIQALSDLTKAVETIGVVVTAKVQEPTSTSERDLLLTGNFESSCLDEDINNGCWCAPDDLKKPIRGE